MTIGTFVVGLILVGVVILSIRSIQKEKHNRKSKGCGGNCNQCKGCH